MSATAKSTATGRKSLSSSQTRTTVRPGQTATSSQVSQTGLQVPSSSSTSTPPPTIPKGALPGVIVVTKPPQQSTATYGIVPNQPITFAWNFSYLTVTQTHLTLSAVCPSGTYPVGPSNGIIPGNAMSVVWDTYAYQTSHPQLPLVQSNYTLTIWGDRGPSAIPLPGFLSPNGAVHFALYTTPITSASGVPSSSTASQHVYHPAIVGLIASLLIVFLSSSLLLRRF